MRIDISDFGGKYTAINGTKSVEVSLLPLIHSAITVGANSYASAFGSTLNSFAFVLHKIFALLAVVELRDSELILPTNYKLLDPSEKASLGYWAGMAICKLVADQVLDITWLQHIGQLKKEIQLKDSESRSTPDLAGLDKSMQWHVIEAKARQIQPSSSTRKQWKNQAGQIAAISRVQPTTNSYCLTLTRSPYSVELVDPPVEHDRPSVSLDFSRQDFLRAYYRPILDFLSQRNRQSEQIMESNAAIYRPAAYDPVSGRMYEIGIERRTLELAQRIQHGVWPDDILSRLSYDAVQRDTEYEYIGSDGIAVRYGESF